jgi:hypothetical protein
VRRLPTRALISSYRVRDHCNGPADADDRFRSASAYETQESERRTFRRTHITHQRGYIRITGSVKKMGVGWCLKKENRENSYRGEILIHCEPRDDNNMKRVKHKSKTHENKNICTRSEFVAV